MTSILDRLQDGAKTYSELPHSPTLDYELLKLLSERKIVRTYNRVILYSLPIVPPQDKPAILPKWQPRKPDKRAVKDPKYRICTKCDEILSRENFRMRQTTRSSVCNGCRNKRRRERRTMGYAHD